ncbi:MAG: TonB-dependent receptor [Ignavibacteriaceae bacterium]|jgi:outer membrane receptor protein involved in Fe transport
MRKFTLILMVLFINLIVLAQQNGQNPGGFQGVIKGKVLDATTNQPIYYANITIYNPKDSTVATGGISDQTGNFVITGVHPGRFFAKVSYIGYKTHLIRSVIVTPAKSTADLGTINITPSAVNMNTVVVKGEKDMVVTNLDKQVINVDKDLASSGGTALDVMQNIPALTVDINGNISLRGNSNVTILIDGKPSGLAGLNSSDVLTSLPASSIKSVELVTNPSAKYDPDGTAGIINIVLKKNTNLGFNGIFNANAGTGNKYTEAANLNYRIDGLNFFGNFVDRSYQDTFINSLNRTFYSNNNNTNAYSSLNQNSGQGESRDFAGANLGVDYLLNDYNTLSFNINYRNFYAPSGGLTNSTSDSSNINQYSVFLNNAMRNVNSYTYTGSYKKEFEKQDEVLTADVFYSNNKMISNQTTNNQYFYEAIGSNIPATLYNANSNNFNDEWTIQANYVDPLGSNNRLEGGFKSYFRHMGMDYNYYDYDYPTVTWINDPAKSDNFDYKEQIHSIYGIYTGAAGDFKYQAGLRAEYATTNSKLFNTNLSFNDTYRSLYPSVYLAYDFTPLQELKISYSRRVDRPNPWQLNPFVNYSDSLNLSSGNPNLQPQYTNSYELGYSTVLFDFNLTPSIFYKTTDGMMTQINTLIGNQVTLATWQNISSEKNYGGEFILNGNLFQWWRLNGNVSYFRRDITDPYFVSGLSDHSYSWTGRINSTWMLDKTFSFQVSSSYNSKAVTPQGTNNAMYFTDVAVKKDFSKNLSATLRVSDIFDTRKYAGETIGTDFISYNEGQRTSRVLYLGFTYNLNNFKPNKDKVKDINMDEEMDSQ